MHKQKGVGIFPSGNLPKVRLGLLRPAACNGKGRSASARMGKWVEHFNYNRLVGRTLQLKQAKGSITSAKTG